MNYIYDGTYEGLLTCLLQCMTTGSWPEHIADSASGEDDLFGRAAKTVITDEQAARQCLARIRCSLGNYPSNHICRVFFSDASAKEMHIAAYVRFGMTVGKDLDRYLSDPRVRAIHDLSRKVSVEIHRMRGLLRFRELADGVCYAGMSPDHDILAFLPRYFSRRIASACWIIHDQRRQKAVVCEQGNCYITDISLEKPLEFSAGEQRFAALWKRYFRDIVLKERTNRKQQSRCMPRRYWPYLIEMDHDE